MVNPPFSIHIPWGMSMEANTTTVSRSCSPHPPQISSHVAAPLRFVLTRCTLRTKVQYVCKEYATLFRTTLTLQCYGSLTVASWKRLSRMPWELRRMHHRYLLVLDLLLKISSLYLPSFSAAQTEGGWAPTYLSFCYSNSNLVHWHGFRLVNILLWKGKWTFDLRKNLRFLDALLFPVRKFTQPQLDLF